MILATHCRAEQDCVGAILYARLTRRTYNRSRVPPKGCRPPIACLRGKEGHAMAFGSFKHWGR